MSETSILPGAEPTTDSGIGMVAPGTDVEESGGHDRRRLMIIGGIAAVIVIAAAAFMLLHKGGSSSPSGAVPPGVPATTTQSSGGSDQGAGTSATGKAASGKQDTTKQGGAVTLPKKAKQPQARDPFQPLVSAPESTSGGATSTTTVTAPTTDGSTGTGSTTGTSPTDGSTDGTTSGTGTTTGTGTTSSATAPLWIQLMNVHGRMATFDVGYAHHKFRRFHVQAPLAGSHQATVFDTVFALVGISGGQVTLQIGDDTPFQLATGIAHTVSG